MSVYFIRPIGMQGPVKIGHSFSPDSRRSTLETWCPFPLEIVAEINGNTITERRFHALFAADHIGREWFKWSPDLQAVIDAVADGSFDLATLPEAVRVTHSRPRDNSYVTPGWRYGRSVQARLQALQRRGMPWQETRTGRSIFDLQDADGPAIEEARQHWEPLIAALQLRYPVKRARRKAA